MRTLAELFENNRLWAESLNRETPDFLQNLARKQAPGYMWIGCSDSRVPANELIGISAGEVFVYRNVANQVQPSDAGITAAIYYAVVVLKVRHIIVCGHYSCGGVMAALEDNTPGPLASWLLPLQVIVERYRPVLDQLDRKKAHHLLCELNVVEQIRTVASLPFVRAAWKKGQELDLHGWMFNIGEGRLHDLNLVVRGCEDADAACDEVARRLIP